MITREQLINDLVRLNLRPGDAVMMHSSLSALGQVDGGVETVVEAIQAVIGTEGTLLAPAFRDSVWDRPEDFAITDCHLCSQRLCPSRQCGFQGVIAEAVRQRPGSLRSCHPTHSWVAVGPNAERLLAGHRLSPTPCGRGNPFEELKALDGCVLMLGVRVNTVTLWHYYEEVMELPYMGHYWPRERHLNHCVGGRRIQYEYPGIMQDVCRAAGILTTGKVGKGDSGLMRARDFNAFMAAIIADDPFCLVLRPPARDNGNLAIDALRKAQNMLYAWQCKPHRSGSAMGYTPRPIPVPDTHAFIRRDCPAFAGEHKADGRCVPLCRANDRHPDLFRYGGIFNTCGVTTCDICSWHALFPPE